MGLEGFLLGLGIDAPKIQESKYDQNPFQSPPPTYAPITPGKVVPNVTGSPNPNKVYQEILQHAEQGNFVNALEGVKYLRTIADDAMEKGIETIGEGPLSDSDPRDFGIEQWYDLDQFVVYTTIISQLEDIGTKVGQKYVNLADSSIAGDSVDVNLLGAYLDGISNFEQAMGFQLWEPPLVADLGTYKADIVVGAINKFKQLAKQNGYDSVHDDIGRFAESAGYFSRWILEEQGKMENQAELLDLPMYPPN